MFIESLLLSITEFIIFLMVVLGISIHFIYQSNQEHKPSPGPNLIIAWHRTQLCSGVPGLEP